MLTRRDTLRALGVAGVATPLLEACGQTGQMGRALQSSPGAIRLVSADVARSTGDPAAMPDTVAAMAGFASDLWDTLPGGANLAISPYSIVVALAMTANGAAGETRRQMLEVIHVASLSGYNRGLAALTQEIEGLAGSVKLVEGRRGQIALASANQLFGDRATTWRQAFLTVLAKEYGAGMRAVDFRRASEQARTLVNDWTSEQTRGRIPQILPPGSVDPLTRLVLVNALYLKAPWQTPFDKASTHDGPFHRTDGETVTAPMMTAEVGTATYVSGQHWQGARLDYAGRTLAMTVALPDAGADAVALRDLVTTGLRATGTPDVKLTMPRWTYRVATDLVQPLETLGMVQAFGPQADFSAMTTDGDLSVSDVLHQTFIAVDEAGTEAAAATAVVMNATGMSVAHHELVLDRPFLFVLHDTAHGTPLFVGRVVDPS
ncbi:MAG: serpin family protein [Nocardioides sp.]|nr:serpin family protein [Nocardioides sp.]